MNITAYRRISQVAFIFFIFLVPVLNILRFDSATGELIIFGQVWGLGLKEGFYADRSVSGALQVTLQFFLKAILPWLLVLTIFPLLGFLTGRLFCGWFCPEGALFELSDFLTTKLLGRRSLYARKPGDPDVKESGRTLYFIIALLSAIVIPICGGIALTGYFVAPQTIWRQIISWNFTIGVKSGIIGVSIYMLITSIFIRHALCRFVCAAGLMQMLFAWVGPYSLRLKMDVSRADECTNCKGCDRACFMNVTPRSARRDISCVNCGACIVACNRELGPDRGLFHYSMGDSCVSPEGNCEDMKKASAPSSQPS